MDKLTVCVLHMATFCTEIGALVSSLKLHGVCMLSAIVQEQ